jgi:adenylylsulfate kinase
MVIWLIGLAGAGKTSLGRALTAELRNRGQKIVFLDGDSFREIMGDDLGHTLEDRERNGWRICRMCRFLEQQDVTVVCSILSMFPDQRAWNRKTYNAYFEVYIEVPLEVLEQRDQKGLYSAARAGRVRNVAGVDLEFSPPSAPDHVFRNDRYIDDFTPAARTIADAVEKNMQS